MMSAILSLMPCDLFLNVEVNLSNSDASFVSLFVLLFRLVFELRLKLSDLFITLMLRFSEFSVEVMEVEKLKIEEDDVSLDEDELLVAAFLFAECSDERLRIECAFEHGKQ